jgi:TolB protein
MKTAFLLLICLFLVSAISAQDSGLPQLPGKIAYVGTDFNVYTLDSTTHERAAITDDAGRVADRVRFYQWPTWSRDGRLSYFQTETDGRTMQELRAFISEDGTAAGEEVYMTDERSFTYAYWSPQNCTEGESCRDLAVLMSTQAGFVVERLRDSSEESSSETIGTAPGQFYFSWSPDGSRMLWQRSGQTLDVYSTVDNEVVETLTQLPGRFSAPMWSPVDDRLLFGARSEDGAATDIVIVSPDGSAQPLVSGLAGQVAFAWSPDGNAVAYTEDQGTLFVVDAVSGEQISRSASTGVLGFFWSPDSSRIAYVTLASEPGSITAMDSKNDLAKLAAQAQEFPPLSWSVLDVETRTVWRSGSFTPTRDLIYLLSFFDQFAQSHRIWSPDSRHIVYSEMTADNRPVISILDTTQELPVPLSVADGLIGIWSFE